MTTKSILKEARRYADGDGVFIDLERAKSLYDEIADSLPKKDLILYRELCALYPEPQDEQVFTPCEYTIPSVMFMSDFAVEPCSSDTSTPSSEQIRALLEDLLDHADSKMMKKIYAALCNISRPAAPKREENVRFGNNLKVLLLQCGKSASEICSYGSDRLRKITPAALCRKISGQDGTTPETLNRILAPFNELWLYDHRFKIAKVKFSDPNKHSITREDMYLPLDEFVLLFADLVIDEGLRRLLDNAGITLPE